MSEEKPVFKITDRRLFNTDGTPRDLPREEEKEQPPAPEPSATPAPAVASAPQPSVAAKVEETQTAATSSSSTGGGEAASASRARPSEIEHEGLAEEDMPGADDPASFINFLMSIASNAASALGMMEHPVTGQQGVDLRLAKHWIDILGMLEQKTRGNLAPQEHQILESLLADLRMQYVSLTSAPRPSGPRFSGRDIIGGK
jgi:hypothetical protein